MGREPVLATATNRCRHQLAWMQCRKGWYLSRFFFVVASLTSATSIQHPRYNDKGSTMHCFGPDVGLLVELCPVQLATHPCTGGMIQWCNFGFAMMLLCVPTAVGAVVIALSERVFGTRPPQGGATILPVPVPAPVPDDGKDIYDAFGDDDDDVGL